MNVTDIPASTGRTNAVHTCGLVIEVVDRYITDAPPGPRGNPLGFIELYRENAHGDPDDLLLECPRCGEDLDLADLTVQSPTFVVLVLEPATPIEPSLTIEQQINEAFVFRTEAEADAWITLFQERAGGAPGKRFLIMLTSDPRVVRSG